MNLDVIEPVECPDFLRALSEMLNYHGLDEAHTGLITDCLRCLTHFETIEDCWAMPASHDIAADLKWILDRLPGKGQRFADLNVGPGPDEIKQMDDDSLDELLAASIHKEICHRIWRMEKAWGHLFGKEEPELESRRYFVRLFMAVFEKNEPAVERWMKTNIDDPHRHIRLPHTNCLDEPGE